MRAVIAACVVTLAACAPAPAAPPPPPVPSTVSTPDLVKAMDVKVKVALLPLDAFADLGSRFVADKPELTAELADTAGRISSVCLGARVDAGVSTSRRRVWTNIDQQVFGLVGVSAQHVVDSVRDTARSCKTYTAQINKPERTVKADLDIPKPAGAEDFYAFCHSMPDVADLAWKCEAVFSRRDLVVAVSASASSEENATEGLGLVVERAAKALA
ncbi:hypothetical protein JNUCC0626_29170 [Lentzea sp. JNUCC 0626]|uniref:hypothetical protein n=1 Tax=Lentzea sp. JNUCC 0626 TaxID=3367513 RepID=UPI0037479F91